MNDLVLAFQGVSLAYNDNPVVTELSLTVGAGEYVSLVGPNGAGKSTLLKAVLRIVPLAAGSINLCGQNQSVLSQSEIAKLTGYVPQTVTLVFPISVLDFVLLGRYPFLRPLRNDGERERELAIKALDLVGLNNLAERSVLALSGGERQRVLLAAALIHEPKLLLLDEPATFLDPGGQEELYRLLRAIVEKKGLSILAVTHDLNVAAIFSDRVVGLAHGAIAFSGTPAELMTDATMTRIFGRKFFLAAHPKRNLAMIVPE